MCHSARCGCYFGGDCNVGEQSRSEIKAKIKKIQDYLAWKEIYIIPDSRKQMEGKVAALQWSMYRTKKRVKQQLENCYNSNETGDLGSVGGYSAYTRGYISGLRWVLGW